MGEPRHYKIKKAKGYDDFVLEYMKKENLSKEEIYELNGGKKPKVIGNIKNSRVSGYKN